ncbi:hypothetical protein GCM10029964_088590 [Kibdelosporangium lantanae]
MIENPPQAIVVDNNGGTHADTSAGLPPLTPQEKEAVITNVVDILKDDPSGTPTKGTIDDLVNQEVNRIRQGDRPMPPESTAHPTAESPEVTSLRKQIADVDKEMVRPNASEEELRGLRDKHDALQAQLDEATGYVPHDYAKGYEHTATTRDEQGTVYRPRTDQASGTTGKLPENDQTSRTTGKLPETARTEKPTEVDRTRKPTALLPENEATVKATVKLPETGGRRYEEGYRGVTNDPQGTDICNCFPAGTQVATSRGQVPIEGIRVGDQVWAHDLGTGRTELRPVTALFRRQADEMLTADVSGVPVQVTRDHPFWVPGKGWVAAGELHAGDVLLRRDGGTSRVDAVSARPVSTTVYNFTVAGDHDYYVSPAQLLVHNCTMPLPPRQPGRFRWMRRTSPGGTRSGRRWSTSSGRT